MFYGEGAQNKNGGDAPGQGGGAGSGKGCFPFRPVNILIFMCSDILKQVKDK